MRDRSHQEQHPGTDSAQLEPIEPHPHASDAPPQAVRTDEALAAMIGQLEAAGSFAFDSEFIGERSYEPRLCLVQVATPHDVFLVDPLAELNLSPLWQLLISPAVEKVVLDGRQDFIPAVRETGRPPANIMDVQIAAGMIDPDYPLSLMKLIEKFADVSLGKGLGFTRWDRRPLSAVQMRYAANDVRYLPAARLALGERLEELGRAAWARGECAAALEDKSLYEPEPEDLYLRVRKRGRLGRRELAILRELAIVRDEAACEQDVPPRTLLKDGILIAMANRPIRRAEDLAGIKGMPRPVKRKYGDRIVEATAAAMALPKEKLPQDEPADYPALRSRVAPAWEALNELCLRESVAPALVTSRKNLTRTCQAIADGADPEKHPLFRGWRKELLGDLLEDRLLSQSAPGEE